MIINDLEIDKSYTSGSSTGLIVQSKKDTKSQTSGTLSRLGEFAFSEFHYKPDILLQASSVLATIENDAVRNGANKILFIIYNVLNNYLDISELPPLRAFQSKDDSIIFEWVFPHFRVGFSVEQEVGDSGWYLVSDDLAGNITASGEIFGDTGTEKIVFWLLQYISLNY